MAEWALMLALIHVTRLPEVEIGEQLLVLSCDLVGRMLADLMWLAGAGSCFGVDPGYGGRVKLDILYKRARGSRWLEELALETSLHDASVDLLVDASGNPVSIEFDARS